MYTQKPFSTLVRMHMYVYNNCVYPPINLVWRVQECDKILYRYRV